MVKKDTFSCLHPNLDGDLATELNPDRVRTGNQYYNGLFAINPKSCPASNKLSIVAGVAAATITNKKG